MRVSAGGVVFRREPQRRERPPWQERRPRTRSFGGGGSPRFADRDSACTLTLPRGGVNVYYPRPAECAGGKSR